MIALVYNWWNLFVRLAIPEKHHEAITSRPLLLSSIGRLTKSGNQKKMFITSNHGDVKKLQGIYKRLNQFFKQLKAIAPQLTLDECWGYILEKAMEKFELVSDKSRQIKLPAPA